MLFWLRSALLLPVLLPQGLRTRRQTPRLPEPPGDRSGVRGQGHRLRVLITGDSAAAGVGAGHQDQALLGQLVQKLAADHTVHWRLAARTGATTESTLADLSSHPRGRFDVAVTSLGVNDLTAGVRRSVWLARQADLRTLLRTRFGVRLLVISGLPPVRLFPALPQPLRWHLGLRAKEMDRDIRAAVRSEPDCVYVPLDVPGDPALMASDGFHPGPAIYAAWAESAATAIMRAGAVA